MIKCVYCKESEFEVGKGSEEHAILSSLGGKKASRNICCQKCNNELGDEIDKVVSEEFSFISNFISVKTGRNKSAKTIKNAGVMNGKEFELKPGGTPYFSSAEFESKKEDENRIEASISARSPKEALRLMEQFAKKHGKSLGDLQNANVRIVSDYNTPMVSGTLNLGGDLFLRSIAKMMLTYLATLCDQSRLRDGSSEKFINYIKNTSEENVNVSFDYNSIFPLSKLECKVSHLIFIWADPKSKLVFCGLQLFGYIKFSAVITDCWNGGEIKKCHEVDPTSGQILDSDFNFDDVDIRQIVDGMGYEASQFEIAINLLMKTVVELQQESATRNTIDTAIEAAFANQNFQDLTPDNVNEFVSNVMVHIQAQMHRSVVNQKFTLEQLKQLDK